MRTALALGLVLLLGPGNPAGAETRSLPLEHRSGAELEPLVRPLAEPGVAVAADGRRLVLRGEAGALDDLERAVRALDRPRRDLWLRLRRLRGGAATDSGNRVRSTADPRAVSLRLREGDTVTWDRALLHRVTGDRALAAGRRGPVLAEQGRLLWLQRGLRARVQLLGEGFVAHLEAAADQALEDGALRDRLSTTVSGPLGRWVSVQAPGAAPADPEVRRFTTRPGEGRSAGLELRVDPAAP